MSTSWRSSACLRLVMSRVKPLRRTTRPAVSNSAFDVSSSHTSRASERMKRKDRIGGVVDADLMDERLEAGAVVQMNPREELRGGERLLWIKAQDLRSV